MYNYKCESYTKISNYTLKCKCKKFILINNKSFCYFHSIITFNKSILIIQKHYKGFYIRKKLNNIFLKLPYDLRNKIIFHIRENFLIKKYNNDPITKILETKIDLFHLHSIIERIKPHSFVYAPINNEELDYLINIYRLYTKYANISPCFKYETLFKYKWYIYDEMEYLYETHNYDTYKLDSLMGYIVNFKSFNTYSLLSS